MDTFQNRCKKCLIYLLRKLQHITQVLHVHAYTNNILYLPSLQSCYAIHPTTYTHLISSRRHLSFSFLLSSIEIDCAHHTASAQPSKHISTNQSSIHISTSRVLKSIQSNTRQTNHRPHSTGDRRDTCEAHRSKALSRARKQ